MDVMVLETIATDGDGRARLHRALDHPGAPMSAPAQAAKIGDALPPVEKPPITTTQLVQYAGASGDFNRIHYDEPFANEGGFPSVIAHGMLSMAFFGQLVADWAGGAHQVVRLSARFRRSPSPATASPSAAK